MSLFKYYLLFIIIYQTFASPVDDVNKFIIAFKNLESTGDTIFNIAENVIDFASAFAENSSAAAMFFTKTAKEIISPDTPELAAINLMASFLANTTKDIYKEITMIAGQLNEINNNMGFQQYTALVDTQLQPTTDMLLAVFWNNGSIFFEEVRSRCKHEQVSPKQLLTNIYILMVKNCGQSKHEMEQMTEIYTEAITFFAHFESHAVIPASEFYIYDAYKMDFLLSLVHQDNVTALRILKLLKKEVYNEISVSEIKTILNTYTSPIRASCINEVILTAHKHQTRAVSAAVRRKIRDVQLLLVAGALCADIIAEEQPGRRAMELNKVADLAKIISKFTSFYIHTKLEADFTKGLMAQKAKEYLKPLKIDKFWQYELVAYDVGKILNKMGPENFTTQVIVGQPFTTDDNLFFEWKEDRCFCIKNISDVHYVNVYVCRFDHSAVSNPNSRAKIANKWFDENYNDIYSIMDEFHDTKGCKKMRDEICESLNIPSLNNSELFNSAILLRNVNLYQPAVVKLAVVNQTSYSPPTMRMISFNITDMISYKWGLVFSL